MRDKDFMYFKKINENTIYMATMAVKPDHYGKGIGMKILEEVEKGYTLNDKVIRHAKVVVSSTPDEVPSGTDQTETSAGTSGK